jgi:hypothetical protein
MDMMLSLVAPAVDCDRSRPTTVAMCDCELDGDTRGEVVDDDDEGDGGPDLLSSFESRFINLSGTRFPRLFRLSGSAPASSLRVLCAPDDSLELLGLGLPWLGLDRFVLPLDSLSPLSLLLRWAPMLPFRLRPRTKPLPPPPLDDELLLLLELPKLLLALREPTLRLRFRLSPVAELSPLSLTVDCSLDSKPGRLSPSSSGSSLARLELFRLLRSASISICSSSSSSAISRSSIRSAIIATRSISSYSPRIDRES